MAKKSPKNNNLSRRTKSKFDIGGLESNPNQSTNQWLASMKAPFITPSQKMFPLKMDRGMPDFSSDLPQGTYSPVGAPQGTITSGNQTYAPGSYYTGYEGQYDIDSNQFGVQQGPQTKERAVELGYKEQKINNRWRNPFENVKGNDILNIAPYGLYATNYFLRKQDAIRDEQNYQNRLRNVFTQKPIYDYNALYGPDSSGGTQYQSLIMAKDGASIRRTASPNFGDVEVEGGEFIQLPDLSTQHIQGPSHANGGVHTNLPEGARVFSDHLKPKNSKKTYAQLAKKYDIEKYQKVLDNPYAGGPDRRTAELMLRRNQSILNELFADQQIQNGNSDGTDQAEVMAKFGLDLKKGEKLSFTDPFEYGGQYLGGPAEFNYGGYYMDGGMFPWDSPYYGGTSGDTSNLTIGTDQIGDASFQMGGYNMQEGDAQVEAEAQARLKAQEDAAINEGAPVSTNPDAYNDDASFGQNYVSDLTTGFPATTPTQIPQLSPMVNQQAIAAAIDKDMPLTAPIQEQEQEEDNQPLSFAEFKETQPRNISNPKLQKLYKDYIAGVYQIDTRQDEEEDVATEEVNTGETTEEEGGKLFGQSGFVRPGTKKEENQTKGLKRAQQIVEAYKRDPDYKFNNKDLPLIKAELIKALSEWGIDTPENKKAVEKVNSLGGFTNVAESLQNKVYETDPEVAVDYGIKEASTLQGLQFLSNPKKISDAELEKITGGNKALKNKIKAAQVGSYGTFTPEERNTISEGVKTLPKEKQTEYGKTNFMDKAWFFRRPIIKEVEFDNKEEYDNYVKQINVGGKYVGQEGEKRGLYIKPIYKGEDPEGEKPKNPPVPVNSPEGNQFVPPQAMKQMPSTPGRFPAYQAIPEAMGYLSGLNPYTYFTPDYTHTEIAPPTLNIDPELQSIDDSLQSTIRQSTGNASVDSSRRAALFNQALGAKQQAFGRKQNFDAQARFQADQYNAQARDLESYRDVTSAAQVFNEYRAAAQDAAERERLGAITSIVGKKAQHDADEYRKMMYFTTMYPQYYYDGRDKNQPIKFNPYAQDFYSQTAGMYPNQVNLDQATQAVPVSGTSPVVTAKGTPLAFDRNGKPLPEPGASPVITKKGIPLAFDRNGNPLPDPTTIGAQATSNPYMWGQPQMNQNIAYPNFNPMYSTQDYDVMGGNMPTTILPPTQGDMYGLPEEEYLEDTPENMKSKSTQEMKFGAYKTKKK